MLFAKSPSCLCNAGVEAERIIPNTDANNRTMPGPFFILPCSSPSVPFPSPAFSGFTTCLLVELALVEGELLTLKDVAVAAARLTGPAGNDSVQTTSLELLLDGGLDLALGGVALLLLLLDGLALLVLLVGLAALGPLALAADGLAVVGLVPLTERRGVDLDDGGLGQGVGADELVVGRVVGDGDDTGLAGAALGGPGEVAGVETEGTELVVAAAGADGVNALGTDTGVGSLAAGLESALLPCWKRSERTVPPSRTLCLTRGETKSPGRPSYGLSTIWYIYMVLRTVVGALRTGSGTLVTGVARDTHDCGFCIERREKLAKGLKISGGLEGRRHLEARTTRQQRSSNDPNSRKSDGVVMERSLLLCWPARMATYQVNGGAHQCNRIGGTDVGGVTFQEGHGGSRRKSNEGPKSVCGLSAERATTLSENRLA